MGAGANDAFVPSKGGKAKKKTKKAKKAKLTKCAETSLATRQAAANKAFGGDKCTKKDLCMLMKYRGSPNHNKLMSWITTKAGPTIWSSASKKSGVFCTMTDKRGKVKYALQNCEAVAGANDAFVPSKGGKRL